MWVQRAGQNANTATINTKSNVATAISMTANWGESLVMNQLATNPATISAPRTSQLNMIVSCYTGVFKFGSNQAALAMLHRSDSHAETNWQ